MLSMILKSNKLRSVFISNSNCAFKRCNVIKIPSCSFGIDTLENIIKKLPTNETIIDIQKSVFETFEIDQSYSTTIARGIFEAVHAVTGMPWWATIACTAIFAKTITIPSMANQLRVTYVSENQLLTKYTKEQRKEVLPYIEYLPFSNYALPILQVCIFVSAYPALLELSDNIADFKTGGLLWFTDLSMIDNSYVLPTIAAAALCLTLKANNIYKVEDKNKYHILPTLLTFGFLCYSPSSVSLYCCANNTYSLFMASWVKNWKVQKAVKVLDKKADYKRIVEIIKSEGNKAPTRRPKDVSTLADQVNVNEFMNRANVATQ